MADERPPYLPEHIPVVRDRRGSPFTGSGNVRVYTDRQGRTRRAHDDALVDPADPFTVLKE